MKGASMDIQTWIGPIVISAVTAVALGIYRHFIEDALPWFTHLINVIGVAAIVFFSAWAAIAEPWLLLAGVGFFLVVNLAGGFLSSMSRLSAKPAQPHVWVEALSELRRFDWVHLGTWRVDLGGKTPEMTIYERPADGTRVIAIGTAPDEGIVEVESALDKGYLTTLSKRSRTIRPPWMFKQAFPGAAISDLVRAHDDAKHYLRVMGIPDARFPHGQPLEAVSEEQRLHRRFVRTRWWLVAIQPLVLYLTPGRSKPLHRQSDIERQIERYHALVSREPTALFPTTP